MLYLGKKQIKEYIKKGGGFLGICGGAYLGQGYEIYNPNYSLALINAKVYFGKGSWKRGEGVIKISLTEKGKKIIPELKTYDYIFLHYNNGPLLIPGQRNKLGPYHELMRYESDIYFHAKMGKGESPGKTLLLQGRFGRGKAVLMAAHAEATPGMKWLLPKLIRLAADNKRVAYPKRFVNLKVINKEQFFNNKWYLKEKNALAVIKNANSFEKEKINSLIRLHTMASRKICDYIPILLKDRSKKVRKLAAELAVKNQCFSIKRKLKKTYEKEKDEDVRAELLKAVEYFKHSPHQSSSLSP